jgi:L-alanine-DL-glutamate epimerase-like enolase superfamily enzyme
MKAMRIVSIRAHAWTLPLRAPFAIAKRTALEAQNVLVIVETEEGVIQGFGEIAPVGYVTGESVSSVLAALEAVGERFVGLSLDRLRPLWDLAGRFLGDARSARAGLEMALCDAWGKRWALPLWQFFGGAQETLTTDMTIPLVSPEEAGLLAAAAVRAGFRHLKIKVGASAGHDADFARIAHVLEAAPDVFLRIDANQAFTPEEAVAFAAALEQRSARVELIEQPVAAEDHAGLKYVKDHVRIPVFADEAAQDVADVVRLLRDDAVDGINIKLMKSGLTGALQIIALCRAAEKKLMLGCMLESSLGIAAAAQIAGGTGAFDFLDLDSHHLLAPIPGLAGGFTDTGALLRVGGDSAGGWGVTLPEITTGFSALAGTI